MAEPQVSSTPKVTLRINPQKITSWKLSRFWSATLLIKKLNLKKALDKNPRVKPRVRIGIKFGGYNVYILKCADKSLYTGIALDLEKRVRQHNGLVSGGAKYTRSHRPVKLVFTEKYKSRKKASQREYEIKAMTRVEKQKLVKSIEKLV